MLECPFTWKFDKTERAPTRRAVNNEEKSVEVLAFSEVRWPGHGVSHLEDTVIAHSDWSDKASHQCSRGVAVLLSERAASAWRSAGSVFDPVSERILRIFLKFYSGFMSLIAVYAPTKCIWY